MSDSTAIEWTDATWNPTRGCTEIAPGCAHCYAKTFAERFRGVPGHPYELGFDPRIAPDKLTEPLKWKKPRRIFVDSMSDLFHGAFSAEYIDRCVAVMALSRWHTFQLLTKRPARAAIYFRDLTWERLREAANCGIDGQESRPGSPNLTTIGHKIRDARFLDGDDRAMAPLSTTLPLRNIHIGTSIANQTDADKNIPYLLQIPAAVRFLSVEPLIGPVDLTPWLFSRMPVASLSPFAVEARKEYRRDVIHWVIVGGESGPGARPCNVEWIRSIVAQCKAAGVPCFVKQLGARPTLEAPILAEWPTARWGSDGVGTQMGRAHLSDKKGGDWIEWPADLRVREFPREVSA